MRVVTIKKNLYSFGELSPKAQEEAKQVYLDTCRESSEFEDMLREDLNSFFPGADLNFQYSLSCCQGDGLNIYGILPTKCMKNCVERHTNSDPLFSFYRGDKVLTDEEWDFVQQYSDSHGDIVLPENRQYSYCIAYRADIIDDLSTVRKNPKALRILLKYDRLITVFFDQFCKQWENAGYEYFFGSNLTNEDWNELFNEMEWEFFDSGEPFLEQALDKDNDIDEEIENEI